MGVTGFDLSPEAVDTAAKNCPEGTFLAASCTGLSSQSSKSLSDPIIDASPYDVALDSALLHCLSDDDAVTYVTGLAKLLRQGGTFYVGCFRIRIQTRGRIRGGFQKIIWNVY